MTLSALKALFIKDFKTSVRELEFVLYILGPLVAAGVLKLAGGFIDAAALPTEEQLAHQLDALADLLR